MTKLHPSTGSPAESAAIDSFAVTNAVEASDADLPTAVIDREARRKARDAALSSQSGEASQVLAGRYEILGLLGVGGMGSVYRARDRELEETVALKMLRRELVDTPGMLERFRREVKLARRVTHRNVARVFDIGEHEGEKFLTMELVDGESLATLLGREKRLTIQRAVELAGDICAGLASAHAAGVVHRDLKPDNVLIARDGRVVVTDFGIARAPLDVGATQTGGAFVGTPAYMAPEQVEGRADVDARADIYAFGALLYELFTGHRAWPGETAFMVAAARLTAPPPDPRQKRPDMPTACAELVLRCMARKPEERFASIGEVASALSVITLPVIPSPGAASASTPIGGSAQRITVRPPTPSSSPSVVVQPAQPMSGAITSSPAQKTVAVLPFRNGGPPDDDYLAEEITDDLIDSLSMTRGLKVRSRGAVMKFKGIDRDPREIGRDLEVQVVAEGSVRRARGQVRVSARLISVEDGFQLWAKRFDRPEQEVLSINDEAASAIAEALTLDRAVEARAAPSNPAAVDLYIRARHEYRRNWMGDQRRTLELFAQAEELAPGDLMILSGKALVMARQTFLTGSGAEQAIVIARQVIAASPQLAEGRLALGTALIQVGDLKGAVRELRQAVALGPGLAEAHMMLARLLSETLALQDAIRYCKNALVLDPGLGLAGGLLARCYALLGEWDHVAALIQEDKALVSITMQSRFVIWRRDREEAQRLLETVDQSRLVIMQWFGYLRAVIDDKLPDPMPLEAINRKLGVSSSMVSSGESRRVGFMLQIEAELYAYFGMRDHALTQIERSVEHRLFDVIWLDACPLFEGMRAEPRFVAARAIVAARAQEVVDAYRAG